MEQYILLPSLGITIGQALEKVLGEIKSDPFWVSLGFVGQVVFFSRFFLQWLASEKRKKSYIPVYFWYLSMVGSMMLFSYAVHLLNPVFIVAYGTGLVIYIRNLTLIYAHKGKDAQPQG